MIIRKWLGRMRFWLQGGEKNCRGCCLWCRWYKKCLDEYAEVAEKKVKCDGGNGNIF